jgi:hypothetical protein
MLQNSRLKSGFANQRKLCCRQVVDLIHSQEPLEALFEEDESEEKKRRR